ncbi:MAG: preprotein translocase subunit YajC [Thermotogota bacterium]
MEFLFRAFGPPDSTAAPQTTEGAADGSAGVAGGGAMGMIIWIVILFAMFYFLIIMPQRKKDKEFKSMMGKLKVGDKIVHRRHNWKGSFDGRNYIGDKVR